MKAIALAVLSVVAVGCSHGLQETAFKDDNGVYIVSRSLVNDRITSTQPHVTGIFACTGKFTKMEMRDLSLDGVDRSEYKGCQPIQGAYQQTSDQPVATLYKGPVEAAIIGGSIGAGLAVSGTDVIQQGASASSSSSSRSSNRRGHHR